jgi:hypothetical protein
MDIKAMRIDSALKQKKGIHFILASVILWSACTVLHTTNLPILTKNLYTFFITAPLVPLAFMISKLIGVDFQNKSNPLTDLGILFSMNQMLYLIIAMWIFNAAPDKMLMVIAIIFGAHLLPYGWLYMSKTYMILSVFIPIFSLIVGLNFEPYILGLSMIVIETIFSIVLWLEVKNLATKTQSQA